MDRLTDIPGYRVADYKTRTLYISTEDTVVRLPKDVQYYVKNNILVAHAMLTVRQLVCLPFEQ